MAMGTREGRRRQEGFWLTHDELATCLWRIAKLPECVGL